MDENHEIWYVESEAVWCRCGRVYVCCVGSVEQFYSSMFGCCSVLKWKRIINMVCVWCGRKWALMCDKNVIILCSSLIVVVTNVMLKMRVL